jgi:hypothetical protein
VGFSSCTNQESLPLGDVYYVVGFDGGSRVGSGIKTAESRGYLFISEDLKDSLMAQSNLTEKMVGDIRESLYDNLLDGVVSIPAEAFTGGCGWTYFTERYRFSFKVKINHHRPATEEEAKEFYRVVNSFCYTPFSIEIQGHRPVVITSISKIR